MSAASGRSPSRSTRGELNGNSHEPCGARPDHLWEVMDDGEGWRCLICSRVTDDAALVCTGRRVTDA